jgi:N-acetylmuramoyl-L-alanine amidase
LFFVVLGVVGLIAAAAATAWVMRSDPATTVAAVDSELPSASTEVTTSLPPQVSTTTTTMGAPDIPGAPVGVPAAPDPEPPPPAPGIEPGFDGVGMVIVAEGGADLVEQPGAVPYVRARSGLVFGAEGWDGEWIQVLTTCDQVAWVHRSEVNAIARADPAGAPMSMADAVIVIDPGHGGPNKIGAVSPDGSMLEKDVNVDIARRIRDLFEEPHHVEWRTGVLYEGSTVPAAERVIITMPGEGSDADFEAGLIYRARLANALGAHVLVSVHNNAGWEIQLDGPGSEAYYQSQEPLTAESRRLASILVDEFQRSFRSFGADWVGARFVGAKSRLSPRDADSQLYGILRRTDMPATIAEGAYLSNPSEAALLATAEFRQAYAEAVYRGIVRFLTTDDRGGPSTDPEVWAAGAGSGDATAECEVPAEA